MADISTSFPNLETQTKIAKSLQDIADKYNKITDIVYPVGSIYMSVSSTEPSLLFGGTWEQLDNLYSDPDYSKAKITDANENVALTVYRWKRTA